MSIPISYCSVVRAAKDADAFNRLVNMMRFNLKFGAFSQFPCRCEPQCECSDEELDAMNDKLTAALKVDSKVD